MPKRIYVGNLPFKATTREIEKMFASYGKVVNVTIENKGRSTVATVDMASDSAGTSAIKGLVGAKMGTNILNVSEARPRTE